MTTSDTTIAVAAAVQALATMVLVGVTIWYVKVTKGILQTGKDQLAESRQLLDSSLRQSRNQLKAHLTRFTNVVQPLPPTAIPVQQLRISALWSAEDEAVLSGLAARVSEEVSALASTLVPSLMWLRQLQVRILSRTEMEGYGRNPDETKLYHRHRSAAEEGLNDMERALERG